MRWLNPVRKRKLNTPTTITYIYTVYSTKINGNLFIHFHFFYREIPGNNNKKKIKFMYSLVLATYYLLAAISDLYVFLRT